MNGASRSLSFFWPECSAPRLLRLSLSGKESSWSGLVSMSELGEQPITLPNQQGSTYVHNRAKRAQASPVTDGVCGRIFMSVVVKQFYNIVYAVLKRGDERYPPCRVLNRTRWNFQVILNPNVQCIDSLVFGYIFHILRELLL